jgi:uncharacterized protein YebE (UPF0316 family)
MMGYALGFAAGTYVGMYLENILSIGKVIIMGHYPRGGR